MDTVLSELPSQYAILAPEGAHRPHQDWSPRTGSFTIRHPTLATAKSASSEGLAQCLSALAAQCGRQVPECVLHGILIDSLLAEEFYDRSPARKRLTGERCQRGSSVTQPSLGNVLDEREPSP
jgi:hypothetical protein